MKKRTPLTRRDFLKLTATASGILMLQACGGKAVTETADTATGESSEAPAAAPTQDMRYGGTLTMAMAGSPGQLDPALITSNEDYVIAFQSYEALTWVDHNLIAQPQLAKSWSASDDLLTWTFILQQGVKFHHGKDFNADDVIYSFERLLNPDTGSPARSVLAFLDNVEKADEYSVVFNLNTPNADLPVSLGLAQCRIAPSDRTPEQLAEESSGTGPFKLSEYIPGDHSTLVRNEDYWQEGLPYLDKFRIVYMPEEATQVAALTGGTIDMIWQLSPENIPTVDATPNISSIEVPSGLYQNVVMNCTEAPFDDIRVRQAIKHCMDRDGIRQVTMQGMGENGNDQPIAPVNPYWAGLEPLEYNIDKAKELLAAAGYADGLDITLVTSPVRPGLMELSVAFQEMVKPAGINCQLERVPTDLYWSEYWMKVPLCVSNWNMRSSADETLSIAYHSEAAWNESFFASERLDQVIEEARGEKDETKRKELYTEAQKILSEEGGVMIPFFKPLIMAMSDKIKQYEPHPSGWVDVRNTQIAQ